MLWIGFSSSRFYPFVSFKCVDAFIHPLSTISTFILMIVSLCCIRKHDRNIIIFRCGIFNVNISVLIQFRIEWQSSKQPFEANEMRTSCTVRWIFPYQCILKAQSMFIVFIGWHICRACVHRLNFDGIFRWWHSERIHSRWYCIHFCALVFYFGVLHEIWFSHKIMAMNSFTLTQAHTANKCFCQLLSSVDHIWIKLFSFSCANWLRLTTEMTGFITKYRFYFAVYLNRLHYDSIEYFL